MVVHQDWRYRDFVTLIAMVEHLVHAYGDAQYFDAAEELACDRRSFNSVAMELTQAQECARRLSNEFRDVTPQLPWRELRGMRNAIIHECDAIDEEVLYSTAISDAWELAQMLKPKVEAMAAAFCVELGKVWDELWQCSSESA
ncbi:DUF86 domain-containing protein [Bifidobacterium pseudocatenulatum]|uniref:HepT-like ribonuclease domain-containing protein n=1 Tax=Bifidobacterium pseudocatenulatum TaxID=28026 RepID=UPI000E468C56|nr:HepT-like ribonuclease domain-containing protein [Bifidobacterium pseudocatenulatum]RGX52310.1 DUF86 domain-containing protein [Bifidobacterium pseudocatenulatum]